MISNNHRIITITSKYGISVFWTNCISCGLFCTWGGADHPEIRKIRKIRNFSILINWNTEFQYLIICQIGVFKGSWLCLLLWGPSPLHQGAFWLQRLVKLRCFMAFSRDWQKQPEDLDLKRSNVKEQEANGQESQTIYRNDGFSTKEKSIFEKKSSI